MEAELCLDSGCVCVCVCVWEFLLVVVVVRMAEDDVRETGTAKKACADTVTVATSSTIRWWEAMALVLFIVEYIVSEQVVPVVGWLKVTHTDQPAPSFRSRRRSYAG